jgi:hypothetical protein
MDFNSAFKGLRKLVVIFWNTRLMKNCGKANIGTFLNHVTYRGGEGRRQKQNNGTILRPTLLNYRFQIKGSSHDRN